MRKCLLIAALLAAEKVPSVLGASPGDEVIVVYNSTLPVSRRIAEYYAQQRHVPAAQVFGFQLSTNQDISRAEFRDSLERPLAKAIDSHKLWRITSHIVPATNHHPAQVDWAVSESKIRYAVLCYGVPLRINPDPDLKEDGAEKLRPEMRRNEAAVDSELTLLPWIERKLPLAGPLRNPVYGTTNAAALHPTNGVLIVARLDGPDADVARRLVDKALEAETNGLWGRAYIDVRNTTEPGYKIGDDLIRSAGEICRHLGFETVFDENPGTFPAGFPMSQIGIYIGWYAEHVTGPFALPRVEFMPGAFAYHLHSFSACTLRSTNQYWAGPLLAKGAAATMGCVFEPYLTGTPDMAIFASRFIYNGFSFGEASLTSQPVLSWQTTAIGDPLYRPFGINPEQLQDALLQRHSNLVEWCFLRLVNLNLANGKPVADCVGFLEQLGATKHSAVLTEKLGDLYAAQGKPSSATHEYEKALGLGPSPQQKVRLLLNMGEKFISLDQPSQAYAAYHRLLLECADYADKQEIYRKLLPLAEKLSKKEEVRDLRAALTGLK
jgi:uncharacterized protein (TIGR03790 family)